MLKIAFKIVFTVCTQKGDQGGGAKKGDQGGQFCDYNFIQIYRKQGAGEGVKWHTKASYVCG